MNYNKFNNRDWEKISHSMNRQQNNKQKLNIFKQYTSIFFLFTLFFKILPFLKFTIFGFMHLNIKIRNIGNGTWFYMNSKIKSLIIYTSHILILYTLFVTLNTTYLISILYFIILNILGYKLNKLLNKLTENFYNINLVDINKNTPSFISYYKSPKGIIEYYIHSIIPDTVFFNYQENLNYIFNEYTEIEYLGSQIYRLTLIPQEILEHEEQLRKASEKPEINHRDENISITEKIFAIFKSLDLHIIIKDCIDTRFGTTLYFNSDTEYLYIQNKLIEIQHKMKNKNLKITTSDKSQYDYILKIVKSVKIVSFLDCYNEVKPQLTNLSIPFMLGINNNGLIQLIDYIKHYNTLIAGTIRSGKTEFMKNFLILLQLSQKNISTILIDPKNDLTLFKKFDNVLHMTAENIDTIISTLEYLVEEMINRNKLFGENYIIKNIEDYNNTLPKDKQLPYIFLCIEELADLLLIKDQEKREHIDTLIQRLAQRAPSAGIKLFLSTQKPTKDVVGKFTKANCPNRICFSVSDNIESRIVLDTSGAENLNNVGQYIFKSGTIFETYKNPFMSDLEIQNILKIIESYNETQKSN